jgi:hypothetical protein
MTLPIPAKAILQHSIVLGKTRSGKSSKLRVIVEALLTKDEPVCIIDPKGDWWGLKSSRDGKTAGFPVVIFGGDHADVPINELAGAAVAELIATGNRPCIIDLGGWMVGARTRFFIDFAATLFRLTRGARWLVIDECHNFAPEGRVMDPAAGKMLHWANRLASEGSGKGLTLLSASQRPQKVAKDYVTSHETLIACRVIHPLDRNSMKDWIDGCADPTIGREVLTALAQLDRSEAYCWSPEVGFGPKLVKWPLFETYDSFAPQAHNAPKTLKGWASVNLTDVKAKLAAVVEEAKANDPAALKKEIMTLKAQLGAAKPPAQPMLPVQASTKEKERWLEEGRKQAQLDVWGAAWLAGHEQGYRFAAISLTQKIEAIDMRAAYVAPAVPKMPKLILPDCKIVETPLARMGKEASVESIQSAALPKGPFLPRSRSPEADDNGLTGPQLKLLRSLAWWRAMGKDVVSRVQAAVICEWKVTSSNIRDRCSELSTRGLIEYPSEGKLRLTTLGAHLAPQPDTQRDLRSSVRAILTGPQTKLFDVLWEQKDAISKDEAAQLCDWSPESSNIRDRCSELSSLEVVEYPVKGMVKIQDWLRE